MPTPITLQAFPVARLGKLRELLDILAALRDLDEPITTPGGLRQVVQLLAQVGQLLGLDGPWIARLKSILDDPAVFELVLAIVRYVSASLVTGRDDRVTASETVAPLTIAPQSFADWLPIVLQLLDLLRALQK